MGDLLGSIIVEEREETGPCLFLAFYLLSVRSFLHDEKVAEVCQILVYDRFIYIFPTLVIRTWIIEAAIQAHLERPATEGTCRGVADGHCRGDFRTTKMTTAHGP
ncbi:MAG: hypothetical protein CVV46_06790 [Spirochaetae bacterium HGW-Spirochaetae-2]|nr:MAG: hypothetical protein CVV46_06790 [Spirochaetae bacterium HGW-Spirochaetae-2]